MAGSRGAALDLVYDLWETGANRESIPRVVSSEKLEAQMGDLYPWVKHWN